MLYPVDNRHFTGILTPDRSYPLAGASPVLFMHPFFTDYEPNPPQEHIETTAHYKARRDAFFASRQEPVVVFESEGYFDYFASKIMNTGNVSQLYFVETKKDQPIPMSESSWKQIHNFFRLFKSDIRVAGGFIQENENPEHRGCLGYAMHLLEREGFSVDVMSDLVFP